MSQLDDFYRRRIKNDIMDIYADPVEGIFVIPDEENVTLLHALIIGPEGTPYEGGFFYFLVTYPEKFPFEPPQVKLMTTGDGKVRFNPNLYACGKVCLSILGTWPGPEWKAVMTTKSVLLSIQSLLCENPFYNEPGFSEIGNRMKDRSDAYNQRIHFKRLEVAVCDMTERSLADDSRLTMPRVLKEVVIKTFIKRADYYEKECESSLKLDGNVIDSFSAVSPLLHFSSNLNPLEYPDLLVANQAVVPTFPSTDNCVVAKFDYETQLQRIKKLKELIKTKGNTASDSYESLRSNFTGSHFLSSASGSAN